MRDESVLEKIKDLKKDKLNIENQIQRLIDLMIDGTIDKENYSKKRDSLDSKKEKIDKQIEQYRLLSEDNGKIESGIKNTLENNKILNVFDRDVFDALVDYVIIGGYENGKKLVTSIRVRVEVES